jgi:Predicted transcription factor, homolog of eukaryotic MBF1
MIDSNETRLRVGNIIKNARLKKGLTQRQLGEIIGKSNNAITNWEKGVNSPDVDMIERLCSILEIPVCEMFPSKKEIVSDEQTLAEQNLIKSWRKLSPEDQMKIMGMIELKLQQ